MSPVLTALMIPFLGTALGSAFVFFMKREMPLRAEGNSRWRSFGIGALSGIVEPIGGALVLFLATSILGIMPYMLAFAAGAMLYVVVEELVPEYSQGEHSNIGTIGFALGFILMMVLDVVLG